MRKIIALLTFAILICACEPTAVTTGRHAYKSYFKYILNDPKSLEIHSEDYTIEDNVKVNWTVDYSAKNRLGGRVRKTVHFTTVGTFIVVEDEDGRESYDTKDFL